MNQLQARLNWSFIGLLCLGGMVIDPSGLHNPCTWALGIWNLASLRLAQLVRESGRQ